MVDNLTLSQEDADKLFSDESLSQEVQTTGDLTQEQADQLFSDLEPPQTSAVGAFVRGAERGVIPMVTALPAIGAGAAGGEIIGGVIGGAIGSVLPVAGTAAGAAVGAAIGSFVGGVGGGFAGGVAGAELQDYAVSKLPDSVKKKIGWDEQQQLVDEQQHPYAAQLGGLTPFLLTARPFAAPGATAAKADTALGRFMQDWRTQKAAGGVLMGGWELGQEALNGDIDWTKVGIASAFGAIFNHQNKAGQRLMAVGEAPFNPRLNQIRGLRNEAADEAERIRSVDPGLFSERRMDAGIFYKREINSDLFDPTLREVSVSGILGPGNTEKTFLGLQERNPVADSVSRMLMEDEQAMLYGPQVPDETHIATTARKLDPELFDYRDELLAMADEARTSIESYRKPSMEEYDGLRSQRKELEAELAGTKNKNEQRRIRTQIRFLQNEIDGVWSRMSGEGQLDETLTRHHNDLASINAELRRIGPEVAATNRRAAEALGRGDFIMEITPFEPEAALAGQAGVAPDLFVEAQGEKAGTAAKPSMTEAMAKSAGINVQAEKAKIAEDVRRQYVEAGRTEEEAAAAAALISNRYVTRAATFQGAQGTPFEMYLAKHARVTEWNPKAPPSAPPPAPVTPPTESAAGVAAAETMKAAEAKLAETKTSAPVEPGTLPEAPAAEPTPAQETGSGSVDFATEAPAAPVEPIGPKVGDTLTMSGVKYKIAALDDKSVRLTPTRKKDNAAAISLPRAALDQMLGEHVAPAAQAAGEKITLNGEALDPKLAEIVRAKLAEQKEAPQEATAGRAPDTAEIISLRERMRKEAMSDEYPMSQEQPMPEEQPVSNDNTEETFEPASMAHVSQKDIAAEQEKLKPISDDKLLSELRTEEAAFEKRLADENRKPGVFPTTAKYHAVHRELGRRGLLQDSRELYAFLNQPHLVVDNANAPAAANEPAPIIQRVTTANGTVVDVKPMVVEASDLLTSSDNGYDKALQPRNRDRAASQGQIRDIATRLDPNRLGSSSEADRGAPIVGSDNMVESGNGRVMAIREAYRQNGEAAKRYREWVASQGIDVSKFKEPVLVRQRVTEMTPEQRKAFTVEANQSATLAMSASERAMADSRMLTPETLDLIVNPDDLGAIRNRGFVQAFVRGLPQSEQGMMTTAEGGLSSEGLARVRNAVLAKAYGDASLMARIAEATSDEVKSISNALTSAAPGWAKLRSDVEAGLVRADMDMTPELMEAVKRTADLRGKGVKLDTFLAQQDAFDKLNPSVEKWMRMFYSASGRRAASAADIAERVKFYAEEARKVSAEEGLAFDLTPVRSEDVQALAAQKGKENAGSSDQARLFESSRPSDGAGNEAGGQEAGRQVSGEGGGVAGEAGAGKPESGGGNGQTFEQRTGKGKSERALGKYVKYATERLNEIWLKPEANPSTIIHENGHDFLEQLKDDAGHEAAPNQLRADYETVKNWLGWKEGQKDFTTRQHEKFARGFERYFFDGVAPNKELAAVFERFSNWLRDAYKTVMGLNKPEAIPEEIRAVFDRMLASEPYRVTLAREADRPSSFADTHIADAMKADVTQAGPMADRVEVERTRVIAELPKEIRNELTAAAERNGVGESATGLGAGNSGMGIVEANSGGRSTVPAGGARRADDGSLGASGRNAAEESAGASRGDDTGMVPTGAATLGRDAGSADGRFVDRAGNIRLENLTNREDLRAAIREIAYGNGGFIDARRGVISDIEGLSLAEQIGFDGAEQLVADWVRGQAFNHEEILALRLLIKESTNDLWNKAKAVQDGGDWQAVRDYALARERHIAIQRTLSGATAEWGRAGRAFRDISGDAKAKAVEKLMRQNTGSTLFQLREEADLLSKLDNEAAVNRFARDMERPGFFRGIQDYWINGLISGPTTHSTYVIANEMLALWRAVPETLTRAAISEVARAMGRKAPEGERVRFGEAWQQIVGWGEGFAPGLKAAAGSLKTGVTTLLPGETMRTLPGVQPGQEAVKPAPLDAAYSIWKVLPDIYSHMRSSREALIAYAGALKNGVDGESGFGLSYSPIRRAIPDVTYNGVRVAPIGTMAYAPGRAIQGIHAFHRVQFYFMELNAEAFRRASAELADKKITPDQFAQRLAQLKSNPETDMVKRASDAATEGTMMKQGGELTRRVAGLMNYTTSSGLQPLKFIDPFVHITSNVIENAIVARTPVGFLSKELRADMGGKNGALAQDKAIARMALGTTVMSAVAYAVMEGSMTGGEPSEPSEAAIWRKTHQAYSVKLGDTWYSYHRLGVVGLLMGISADLVAAGKHVAEDKMTEAVSALAEAFYHNIFEESFLRGPAEMFRAVENHERYGPQWIKNFGSSFMPYSVGMSQIARTVDPYSRRAYTFAEALKQKIPYASMDLLPRRDLWGEPVHNQKPTFAGGVVPTAIYQFQPSTDMVDVEMDRLGVKKSQVERKIRNVELDEKQYDDFQRIAGRMAKMQLDGFVKSERYQSYPDDIKRMEIDKIFDHQREAARNLMMMKYKQIPRDAYKSKISGLAR